MYVDNDITFTDGNVLQENTLQLVDYPLHSFINTVPDI